MYWAYLLLLLLLPALLLLPLASVGNILVLLSLFFFLSSTFPSSSPGSRSSRPNRDLATAGASDAMKTMPTFISRHVSEDSRGFESFCPALEFIWKICINYDYKLLSVAVITYVVITILFCCYTIALNWLEFLFISIFFYNCLIKDGRNIFKTRVINRRTFYATRRRSQLGIIRVDALRDLIHSISETTCLVELS